MPRALVVDDEELLRELVQDTLAASGWQVEVAPDAATARSLLRGPAFDLAVVDVHLTGGTSGLALCRELAGEHGVPTLLVSGMSEPAAVEAGLAAGARGFVSKPFRPAELLAEVQAITGE